jgi:hypothetical protein
LNFLQIVNRLKVESGRSGGPIGSVATVGADDARLVAWAADFWRELQTSRDWRWMRATGAALPVLDGQVIYDPDADWALTDFGRWVRPSGDYQPTVTPDGNPGHVSALSWLDYERFRQRFIILPHQPGAPQFWTEGLDGSFMVGPTPTGDWVLTADYWREPTELVADADEPDMPAKFHMLIVWGALMQVAGFDAAPEVYQRALANHDRIHADLKAEQGPVMELHPRRLDRT